jgi:hypothetical protein
VTVPAQTSPFRSLSLNCISLAKPTNGFDTNFAEFPAVCELRITDPAVEHNVQHHIITAGPPTFAKARRLSPEKFAAAKTEFDQMLSSHTVCKSSSNWASGYMNDRHMNVPLLHCLTSYQQVKYKGH